MKLKGEFLVREVAGEIVVLPVGRTALNFNGMICLNTVSALIWKELQEGKTRDEIVKTIVDEFEVWEFNKIPYGKFKVKIFEETDGKFIGRTEIFFSYY